MRPAASLHYQPQSSLSNHMALDKISRDSSLVGDFSSDDEELSMIVDQDPIASSNANNSVTVHNMLASAAFTFSKPLDLDKCCLALGNSYYNPAEFPALRVDVRGRSQDVYTISLFASGRIQSTGGCRPVEAKKAMMKIGRRLNEKYDYGITVQNFEIQNILAVFDACVRVNLSQFASTYDGQVEYEPTTFPAARVRIPIPKAGQQHCDTDGNESDGASELSRTTKLRRLMMGDSDSETPRSQVTKKTSGTKSSPTPTKSKVGSYIIGNKNKRPISTRQKDEKQEKKEAVTTNVFSTGKITFTGAKSIESLNYAIEKLKPYICPVTVPALNLLAPPFPMALQQSIGMTDGHACQNNNAFALPGSIPPSCMNLPSLSFTTQIGPPLASSVAERLHQLALEEQRQLSEEQYRLEQKGNRFKAFQTIPAALQQQTQFGHCSVSFL